MKQLEAILLVNDRGDAVNCHFVGSQVELNSKAEALNDLETHRQELIADGSASEASIITLPISLEGADRLISISNLADRHDGRQEDTLSSLFMLAFNSRRNMP